MTNGSKFLVVSLLLAGTVACSNQMTLKNKQGEEVRVTCQPIYGNWCGKGYPAYDVTGYKPDPVDVWDEACMQHDICYEGENRRACDRAFARRLERLDRQGVPAPHQIVNAYNYFKDRKPSRWFNVSFKDFFNVYALSCRGGHGQPVLFCDVGLGRQNCEISIGLEAYGHWCYCDGPSGRLVGFQRTADDFL